MVLERLLSLRERSPLLSVLDSSAQSASPLLTLLAKRAVRMLPSHPSLLLPHADFPGRNRKVAFVAFEGCSGRPAICALPKPSVIVIRGLQSLRERTVASSASTSAFRSLGAILKDIHDALGASGTISNYIICASLSPSDFLADSLSQALRITLSSLTPSPPSSSSHP